MTGQTASTWRWRHVVNKNEHTSSPDFLERRALRAQQVDLDEVAFLCQSHPNYIRLLSHNNSNTTVQLCSMGLLIIGLKDRVGIRAY